VNRDPRIDAYIAKAQPFARPILEKVRERARAVIPDVQEAMKWGHPTFCRNGQIVLGTAGFKAHAVVHFWRANELGFKTNDEAMGQLGKLTRVDDLPGDVDSMIAKAAELAGRSPAPRRPKREPKPMPPVHPDFAAALDKAPKAKAAFEAFPPGCRREYLDWVSEAKREETRTKRIATAVEWLSEGRRRNWKYENC
jgi:uncharacterized protein YdeI (YjbR/CyaY-like superfamily)